MNEISDTYRQQVINQLLANEKKDDAMVGSNINERSSCNSNEQRVTPKPRSKQNKQVDENDPLAQVLQNKLQEEKQEDENVDGMRKEISENIRVDIIEGML